MSLEVTNILKEIRSVHKLTQEDFAKKLGVTRSAIAQIENGKNKISTELAIKISNIFKISLDTLLGTKELIINNSINSSSSNKDEIYFESALLELEIDKIEILKSIISKFCSERKMKGITPTYTAFAKSSNYNEKIEEYYTKSKNNEKLSSDFIIEINKIVEFAQKCLFNDLYSNMTFAYNSLQQFYSTEEKEEITVFNGFIEKMKNLKDEENKKISE